MAPRPHNWRRIDVSHEHIDHLRGAGILARGYKLPVVASEGTFLAGADQFGVLPEKVVQRSLTSLALLRSQELTPGREVCVAGLTVRTFAVSHDAG